MQLSRVHFPVTVLGPGRRLGIWLQGCHVGCRGCVSRDTWNPEGGQWIEPKALVSRCRDQIGNDIDGVTISGGEPFEQPEALYALLDALKPWQAKADFDILCYSGLPLKRLQQEYGYILDRLDALIPEPFAETRQTDSPWRGSANQSLVLLSNKGRVRFAEQESRRAMQIQVDHQKIWMIGIPRPGDMPRLQSLAAARGLSLEDVSWTS